MTPLFHWQMSAVGITENIKGDIKKFEIWYNGKEEVYVVQVSHLSRLKLHTMQWIKSYKCLCHHLLTPPQYLLADGDISKIA